MDADSGEVLFGKELSESHAALDCPHEDNNLGRKLVKLYVFCSRMFYNSAITLRRSYHVTITLRRSYHVTGLYLVELEEIQEIEQFPVFLALLEFHVVLLEPVEGKLRLVIDKYFQSLEESVNREGEEDVGVGGEGCRDGM